MTYLTSWEEFSKATEQLYVADPAKVSTLGKMTENIVLSLMSPLGVQSGIGWFGV